MTEYFRGNLLGTSRLSPGFPEQYDFDALNRRVRVFNSAGGGEEYVFNPSGQRASRWGFNPTTRWLMEGKSYWGSLPVEYYASSQAHFEHQDWLGTDRLRTTYNGGMESNLKSLPWGDGFSFTGSDTNYYHFAGFDQDSPSLERAQFREYSNMAGIWMQPDPYQGSYDFSNPQSLNRYTYVNGMPLSFIDPTGQMFSTAQVAALSKVGFTCGPVCWGIVGALDLAFELKQLFFHKPAFHGSLKPRPNAQPWDEYHIHYGPNIAAAFGLPDVGCEFGACGAGPMGLGSGDASTISSGIKLSPWVFHILALAHAGSTAPNNPGVPKPPDPILKYAQCSAQVRSKAEKGAFITEIASGASLGNLVVGCFYAGPLIGQCEGGVAAVELLVSAVNFGAARTSIWQGETACMQQR